MTSSPSNAGFKPLWKNRLSILSIVIGAFLFVGPASMIILLFLFGIGVSFFVGPMSADAGGWIIIFGIIFGGPIMAILYLLAGALGITCGAAGILRGGQGLALPIIGMILNVIAVLANIILFVSVILYILD